MDAKAIKQKRLWTYEELLERVEEENRIVELWEGELVVAPTPSASHQRITFRLARLLEQFVSARQIGEVFLAPLDVVLTSRRVVQPDIMYISTERRSIVRDHIRGAPDLIMEVVSPGTWRRDRIEKRSLYEQFGVKEYWIVDPEAGTVEVLLLEHGSYQLVGRFGRGEKAYSKLLAGFEVSLDDIF